MIYITVALKPEAQAFVDKYKLQRAKLKNYSLYYDANMTLIISGIGVQNAMDATQTLIDMYDINESDIFLNIGICAANNNYRIGELLEIGSIVYKNQTYILNSKQTITCLDHEASENIYAIVDMESFGFYEAVIHSPAIKNIFIFKVVSDRFEPHKVTKEGTKSLLFHALDTLDTKLFIKASHCD